MNDIIANPDLLLVFALIAPFVVSGLKNPAWSERTKTVLAYGVSIAFGIICAALRIEAGGVGGWSVSVILGHVAVVAWVSHAVYTFLLDGDGTAVAAVNGWLERFGSKGAPPPSDNANSNETLELKGST